MTDDEAKVLESFRAGLARILGVEPDALELSYDTKAQVIHLHSIRLPPIRRVTVEVKIDGK